MIDDINSNDTHDEAGVEAPSSKTDLSYLTFCRDLVELLVADEGKFVAYAGETQLGINSNSFALNASISLPAEEYEVYFIAPQHPDVALGAGGSASD